MEPSNENENGNGNGNEMNPPSNSNNSNNVIELDIPSSPKSQPQQLQQPSYPLIAPSSFRAQPSIPFFSPLNAFETETSRRPVQQLNYSFPQSNQTIQQPQSSLPVLSPSLVTHLDEPIKKSSEQILTTTTIPLSLDQTQTQTQTQIQENLSFPKPPLVNNNNFPSLSSLSTVPPFAQPNTPPSYSIQGQTQTQTQYQPQSQGYSPPKIHPFAYPIPSPTSSNGSTKPTNPTTPATLPPKHIIFPSTPPIPTPKSLHSSSELSNPVLFSSLKVHNRTDITQDSGIPLGILYTPLISSPSFTTLSFSPPKCMKCSAYINRYSKTSNLPDQPWVISWECVICQHKNSINQAGSFDTTHYSNPTVQFIEDAPFLNASDPLRSFSLKTLTIFVIDTNFSQSEMFRICNAITSCVKSFQCPIAIITFSKAISLYLFDKSSGAVVSSTLFSGATSLNSFDIDYIKENAYSCFVFPHSNRTSSTPTTPSSPLIQLRNTTTPPPSPYQPRLTPQSPNNDNNNNNNNNSNINNNNNSNTNNINSQSNSSNSNSTYPNSLFKILQSIINDSVSDNNNDDIKFRSTGVAIETALALADSAKDIFGSNGSVDVITRVIVFTNGGPSFGPGEFPDVALSKVNIKASELQALKQYAIKYYKQLGFSASKKLVHIDMFCSGIATFHLSILNHMVIPSGGSVVMLKDYGKEGGGGFGDDRLKENLQLCLSRIEGKNGVFSVFASKGVALTHIVGPTKLDVDEEVSNVSGSGEDESYEGEISRYEMTSVQENACFALYYELEEDLLDDYLYFQFVVKYNSNNNNGTVVKVVTRRLEITGDLEKFAHSVDPDVSSILLAKRIVVEARRKYMGSGKKNIEETAVQVDSIVLKILKMFARAGKISTFKSIVGLHSTLTPIIYKLFRLRCGPLLGPLLQHPDEIEYLRVLFIYANFKNSMQILDPSLLRAKCSEEGILSEFVPVPLSNLCLRPSWVLLFDQFTHVMIWVGEDIHNKLTNTKVEGEVKNQNVIDACFEYEQKLSLTRFPQPHRMLFKEGDSMERWLLARLDPDHKNFRSVTEESWSRANIFGEMRMDEKQWQSLLSKFFETDDLSYHEYWIHTILPQAKLHKLRPTFGFLMNSQHGGQEYV